MSDYREYPPCEALAPYVACYWTRGAAKSLGAEHRVFPDGCQDIVLRISPRRIQASLVGTMREPLRVPPGRDMEFVAVRFLPAGATALLHIPALELTDRSVALEAALGNSFVGLPGHFDKLAEEKCAEARARHLEAGLLRWLGGARAPSPWLSGVLQRILREPIGHDVDGLSQDAGVSTRQLERAFAHWVGIGPKTFLRVARFQAVLASLRQGRKVETWAELALDCGYYDQAHLIRDFKQFTGSSAQRYFQTLSTMSDFSNLPGAPFVNFRAENTEEKLWSLVNSRPS